MVRRKDGALSLVCWALPCPSLYSPYFVLPWTTGSSKNVHLPSTRLQAPGRQRPLSTSFCTTCLRVSPLGELVKCKSNWLPSRTEFTGAWTCPHTLPGILATLVFWVAGGVPYKRQGSPVVKGDRLWVVLGTSSLWALISSLARWWLKYQLAGCLCN